MNNTAFTSSQQLFDASFSVPRDPRSAEYRLGVLSALRYRIDGVRIRCPYAVGSAQCDAFLSGVDEGHSIFRRHQAGEGLA